ncbi:hypothetical protein VTJ83DRAFT_5112 [Remersonia thermophila]|uniref:lytic cellulose monooxygenase (C4-dehydrogenating) n=1 Tax=Remersonia thermophila TaxID=72144 RepID=A0ABR4DBV6_9PEZI
MHSSTVLTLGLAAAFSPLAAAHTVFTTLFVNDVNQGDGTCVRMAKQGSLSTHPVSLDSSDAACGRNGNDAVAFTCHAPAGAKLTLLFRMWADNSQPGSIDPSHVGPMSIYLKQVSDMATTSATGPGWFKIWSEGYDSATGQWATEKLIANNGLLSVNLPPGLPAGYYLARHETITLQNVTNNKADAQVYVGCAQLFVQGTGSASVPQDKTVSIPGHLTGSEPALVFNPYAQDPATYPAFGPDVFFPAADGSGKKQAQQQQQPTLTHTAGVIPAGCLLKNANWCGVEVPDYADEAACWASAENCWSQLDACYKTAPPSGSRGCKAWEEQKCKVLQRACESRRFPGPENKGQKLDQAAVDGAAPPGALPPAVNAGQRGTETPGGGNGGSARDGDGNGDGDGDVDGKEEEEEEEGGDRSTAAAATLPPRPTPTRKAKSCSEGRRPRRLRRQGRRRSVNY